MPKRSYVELVHFPGQPVGVIANARGTFKSSDGDSIRFGASFMQLVPVRWRISSKP
ncbi:MAG: hypothetical protein CM1200mP14_16450 [Gammaproteobacteria bacterium]|nr:MAG: hypothetical protein CM1200mP14_16450 [Gammaproteobacteria bacterium]